MRVSVLGSGSAGNCTYIGTDRSGILVDLGFGPRSLARRLKQAELADAPIDALLITHGHTDHVRGAAPFLDGNPVSVFMNEGTREEVGELRDADTWERFSTQTTFSVGDIEVEAFSVSHDASEPVGFRLSAEGISGALVTDLGELTPGVIQKLAGCDWLILESNHDEEMLRVGPYPWYLKQRVLSKVGHLSNQALSTFLRNQFDGRAGHIFLAHLSRQNNDPAIAVSNASAALTAHGALLQKSCRLYLTYQNKPSIGLNL